MASEVTDAMIEAGWKAYRAAHSVNPEEIYLAMRAAANKDAGDGWLPIETAPRDGNEILVFGYSPRMAGAANPYMLAPSDFGVVRWSSREYEDFEETEGGLFRKVSRSNAGWQTSPGSLAPFRPTHYRPLPAPPRADQSPDADLLDPSKMSDRTKALLGLTATPPQPDCTKESE